MGALEGLNDQQQKAASHYEGPLLILAGAGSGKTRVLTNRISWLINEKGVSPWNILAITFTNKAASEMRERVNRTAGFGAESIWVATFHKTCGRILRRYIDRLGYGTNFTIYDTDDQKAVVRDVCTRLKIDTKLYKERAFMSAISSAKDELLEPEDYADTAADYFSRKTAEVYAEYQKELKRQNAVDFDDMIRLTVRLFETCPDVLDYYQNRFRFIMVDEYQDTNTAQFRLISLLAGRERNLCVVGDDDQSIYRFRGANIHNILNFEKIFPDTETIKLEQNYRSTGSILKAANAVIAHNQGRKEKTLWTSNEEGEKVRLRGLATAFDEAQHIAEDIAACVSEGTFTYGDCAILYRTNAQSRVLEEKLLMAGIAYKIIGGVNFYARKEIKDLLAYLRAVNNPNDDLSARRVINIPKRGIGAATIAKVDEYAIVNGLSFLQALDRSREIPGLGRTASKADGFASYIRSLRGKSQVLSISELMSDIIETTGYVTELTAEGTEEAKDRIANIDELISKITAYETENESPTLDGFLQEVSLVADTDGIDSEHGQVMLMTLHSAKGLEFPNVYMAGMEEGIFPGFMSIMSDNPLEAIEEERRLCYVGMTRAMKRLTLTAASRRLIRGQWQYNRLSRFVKEIPLELLQSRNMGFDGWNMGLQEKSDSSGHAFSSGSEYSGSPEGKSEFLSSGSSGHQSGFYNRSSSGNEGRTAATAEYQRTKESFREKPFVLSQFKVQKADHLEYTQGDRVSHVKFGQGTVKQITEGPRDYEVTVEFDTCGVRKLLAGFAKLKKI